jgi:predicted DNA-binding transcriptional regulator YafY
MTYIYHKRSKKRQQLAKRGKICPSCKSNKIELTEPGKDRTTFTCQKCGAISTFTNAPETTRTKKEPVKKLSAITLRDRSSERQEPSRQKPKTLENESAYAMLEVIRKSMKDKVILSFDYVASDDKKSSRNVEPYKVTSRNGEAVLYAYDLESGGIRTFKIKNMAYVENQAFAYEPRYDIEDKLKEKND